MKKNIFLFLFIYLINSFNLYAFELSGNVSGNVQFGIEEDFIIFTEQDKRFESRSKAFFELDLEKENFLFYGSGNLNALYARRFSGKTEELNFNFDECYVSYLNEKFEFDFGMKKITWGKLDYISSIDIVNPVCIADLFLKEYKKDAKLGVDILRLGYEANEKLSLELICIPFFKRAVYDRLDEKSSAFNISVFDKINSVYNIGYIQSLIPSSFIYKENLPSRTLKNIEFGFKASYILNDIDMDFYYLNSFTDLPLYEINQGLIPPLIETYKKYNMFGVDFETVRFGWGIRGETVLYSDFPIQKKCLLDYVRCPVISMGLGADKVIKENYINIGVSYKKVLTDEHIYDEKNEVLLCGKYERRFLNDKVRVSLSSIYNVARRNVIAKAVCSTKINDNLLCELFYVFISGSKDKVVDKFKDNDLLGIKFKILF